MNTRNVNISTNLFLMEKIETKKPCFFWLYSENHGAFLLTTKWICFVYAPKKIPLRGHIRGTDFAMTKK